MWKFVRHHRRAFVLLAAAFAVAGVLQFSNTNPAISQSQRLNAYESPSDPGLDPDADEWARVNAIQVPLTAQTGAYSAGGSIKTVKVKALHYGGRLFVRVEWDDPTDDSSTTRVEDFADGVALEFPANGVTTVPSICMGQADAAVNIWHWRADSNVGIHDPAEVYANALIDSVPIAEDLFYTARAAGNPYANPAIGAVQSLSARAFGDLKSLAVQDVDGFGKHHGNSWAVVFSRQFESTNPGHAAFAPGTETDMAIAVWDGSKDERNGQKAVSQFLTVRVGDVPAFTSGGSNIGSILLAAGLFVVVSAAGVGFALYGAKEGK